MKQGESRANHLTRAFKQLGRKYGAVTSRELFLVPSIVCRPEADSRKFMNSDSVVTVYTPQDIASRSGGYAGALRKK